jgi:peptidylprolyl isomerase
VRRLLVLLVLPLLLTACGGGGEGGDGGEASGSALQGVTVEGGQDSKPRLQFDKPYSVDSLQVETLVQGEGVKVGAQDTLSVHYVGINGRTGKEFDSSWSRGEPATFSLGPGMISGFNKALSGQTVGSRVVAAIPPKEGYGSQGNPQAGIRGQDTLLFVVDIREIALSQAEGEAVEPPATVPHLGTNAQGQPTAFHQRPQTAPAPDEVQVHPVIRGEGPPVESGQTVRMHFHGQVYPDGKTIVSSYGQGNAGSLPLGQGQPLPCFDELVGQAAGSRVILICPPDSAFGAQGNPQAGVEGDDTLIFAVDLLDAQ